MEPVRIREVPIRASEFLNLESKIPLPFEGMLVDLVRPHRTIEEKKQATCFSCVVYREQTTRGKKGVESITAFVLDIDDLSDDQWSVVLGNLEGVAHVRHTTHGHRSEEKPGNCWRVILPLTRPITPEEYPKVWVRMHARFAGLTDPAAKDLAHIWLIPSCPAARMSVAQYELLDGEPLDVDSVLALPEPPKEKKRTAKEGKPATGGKVQTGHRHSYLTSLAGAMRRKAMDRNSIIAALVAENLRVCSPPLEEDEVLSIVDSIVEYDEGDPLLLANCTDIGNVERLAAYAGENLRYVIPWGSWLVWDGKAWSKDEHGRIYQIARDVAKAVWSKAQAIEDEKEQGKMIRWAMKMENAHSLTSMLHLAGYLMSVPTEKLDRHPHLLCCRNGVVDLQTGQILPHDRDLYQTRYIDLDFDANAECPLWCSFLDRIFSQNYEMIGFVQRAIGYSLTGSTQEHALMLCYGIGANGKSVFLETLRALVGPYAKQADFSSFVHQKFDPGIRNDLARLVGARLVTAVESDAGKLMAEALVKQLTGGDTITVRFLRQEHFEYTPTFKLWMASNHKPVIRGTDYGIWRRIRLLPFDEVIPEQERDPNLISKLRDELPGILAWAVLGAVWWYKAGLGQCNAVSAATNDYRDQMDDLGGFLEECCRLAPDASIPSGELYSEYARWCEANREKPLSKKSVGMRIIERGFRPKRGNHGVRTWSGLRLKINGEESQPPEVWRNVTALLDQRPKQAELIYS